MPRSRARRSARPAAARAASASLRSACGERALDGGALGDRQGERLAALGDPLGQPGLFRAQLLGLPVELVGVTAGPLRLGVGREQP